jgi:hypothetical protein
MAKQLTAVNFILAVIAVLLAITLPEDRDALGGPGTTAKLIHTAGPGVCRAHGWRGSEFRDL